MKWCEVDSARLPLLHARRYPAITSKNRRRNAVMALQDTKSRIGAMHHQFYINYANVQGCRIKLITVIIWSLIFDLSIAKDKIVFFSFLLFNSETIVETILSILSMFSGSVGSNGSGQGWSTQVEELAEHLAADFDGSLSALAASDLATAVASYNMR